MIDGSNAPHRQPYESTQKLVRDVQRCRSLAEKQQKKNNNEDETKYARLKKSIDMHTLDHTGQTLFSSAYTHLHVGI